jgi:2-hydroxy-3-keto-5-methylthiopentenyl-1-phosphate phosphatase
MENRHMLFIDFDGTITANDVGYELFKKFTNGETETDVQLYRQKKLNSLECLSRECDIWNKHAPNHMDVYDHLDMQALSPGFIDFLKFLDKNNLQPIILSEGFDFYIDRVLVSHHLGHLEKITNKAVYENDLLTSQFPYYEMGCKECSNCKGYHIGQLRSAKMSAIYIGDGHSDLHASRQADIVFAKSHLKALLETEERYFIEYDDFFFITTEVNKVLNRGIFAESQNIDLCFMGDRHYESWQRLCESAEVMRHDSDPAGLRWKEKRYEAIWKIFSVRADVIHLAVEDKNGVFIGEALMSFPNADGFCRHDVKVFPEYQLEGLGQDTWNIILDRAKARWPRAHALVTPAVENVRAIEMFRKLGFEFDGGPRPWPPPGKRNADPILYRRMIKI